MLGTKIALTGALFVIVSGYAIHKIGKKYPGPVIGVLLVTVFWAGFAAVMAGLLMSIWL